jgi:hypothetical protein
VKIGGGIRSVSLFSMASRMVGRIFVPVSDVAKRKTRSLPGVALLGKIHGSISCDAPAIVVPAGQARLNLFG